MNQTQQDLDALWADMLDIVNRQYGEIYRGWFKSMKPIDFSDGSLVLLVEDSYRHEYLNNTCREAFNSALQQATSMLVVVRFVTEAAEPAPRSAPSSASSFSAQYQQPGPADIRLSPAGHEPIPDQIQLDPDYVFENFVTGPCNQLAHAAAVAVSDKPGGNYNPLFIHGSSGLGKTHLLQALCRNVLKHNPDANICYLACESFQNQFMDYVQRNKMDQFRHRYRHVDLLVIDDIHDLQRNSRTQEEFFHTFNTLYQMKKQIVLSSDSSPEDLDEVEDRLMTRFNWGLVAKVEPPCYETRVAIIKKKAQIRGIVVPDNVAGLVAAKINKNTRELEGALTGLQARAMLNGGHITIELARDVMGEPQPTAPPQRISIQNIIDVITDYYDTKLSDLQSKRRPRSLTIPRQVCMYLARNLTKLSLEEIGGYFGGRDHTTVMHAVNKVAADRQTNAAFDLELEQIEARLHGEDQPSVPVAP